MAPAFQGIINKWVKINKTHYEAECPSSDSKALDIYRSKSLFYPHHKGGEEYSIETADETATFDSVSQKKPNAIESSKLHNRSSSSRIISSRKLATSNSYTDLLRKKRADAIPIEQDYEVMENYDGKPLGCSVEELFNPLATHPREFYQESCLLTERHEPPMRLSYDEKRLKYTFDFQHSNALHHEVEECKNCEEVQAKAQKLIEISEFINSRKNTTCGVCRKTIANALKELTSISANCSMSIQPPCDPNIKASSIPTITVPIQISKQDQSFNYQAGESIALMESSQRLLDFMNLHKIRVNQLKQENESKQKRLNAKLSEFSLMCQMIRIEMSKTRDESASKKACDMVLLLEAEIKQLQAQQISMNMIEPPGCLIHQDKEIIFPELATESIMESGSKTPYVRNSSKGILYTDESDVTSCLSDTDTFYASQELVFSLDD